MMVDLERYSAQFRDLPQGVKEAEVNGVLEEELSLEVRDGQIADSKTFRRTRLYVRASADKTGIVCTEKLDEDPREVILRAVNNSRFSNAEEPEPMNEGSQPVRFVGAKSTVGAPELLAFGLELEKKALSRPSVQSVDRCSVRKSVFATRTVNSKGLDAYADNCFYTVFLELSLKREGKPAEGTATASARRLTDIDLDRLVSSAVARADFSDGGGTLKPCVIPSGEYRAVLSNQVVCNIFLIGWLSLSGERMEKGTSVFGPEPGTHIGSSLLNITNAPEHPLTGYYLPLDCEGSVCEKTSIVRDGKLVTPLYTLSSAKRLGKTSTGSAGRVAQMTGVTPINITTVPAVIYIEPGANSQIDLVAEMRDGILLTYSLDEIHSINVTSGEFSIPCGGIYYKDGQPVGTVSQMTMAGNLRDLFGNIRAVGSDLLLNEFYFKNYACGGPSLLVDGLRFAM